MHIDFQLSRRAVMLLAGAIALLAAAGAAYATIPDSGGVYTACRLNGIGTIRLIDPSGPSGSLLSHCTSIETQISWNQKGQPGAAGPAGSPGVSPTVTQLSAGDSHCPAGGASITDSTGTPAYVCNGAPFSGTFTSPNGQFSLSVTDTGVQVVGPNATISVSGNGTVSVQGDHVETVAGSDAVTVQGASTERVGGNDSLMVSGNRTEHVDGNENVTVTGNRTENVAGSITDHAAVSLDLAGATVGINRSAACRPVARVGDLVDSTAILTGSPSLCID
jgi:hypothetical protein